ncbi:ABC-type sugar transport system permease subunit [Kribbella aluminosa]|uniref:ABC-type sugar transport system permease subunit n=1 Tax=Kribbella aluminosa TaxID=416017 RepID=A0ABS4UJ01_9ACTN|nr:sugar ABC transporter permease [Kribbella aluminosa]MBP2351595.1 ABC-type sugar transport system permease subunit [Kribbella aluminosa]
MHRPRRNVLGSPHGGTGQTSAMHSRTRRTRYHWPAYLYLVPALAFYVVFLIRPMVTSAWISLFSWDGISLADWVGLKNYRSVLADPLIWEAVRHSLTFIVFYALLPITLALTVVGIVARIRVRGLTFFRAVLFMPYILSTVVVAISWRWIYDENGPLNGILHTIGLGSLTRAWLGSFSTALTAVGLIGTWITFGLAFVLFISGIQKIPTELYEAARVDGAGPVREFFAVTLPAPARGGPRRAGADRDCRAAQLRYRLEHHSGRSGHIDHGAVVLRVRGRIRDPSGRKSLGDRGADDDLHPLRRRTGDAADA